MKKSQNISAKDVAHELHARDASAIRLYRPVSYMETGIYDREIVFFRSVLGVRVKVSRIV
jgi:hypothetical protein